MELDGMSARWPPKLPLSLDESAQVCCEIAKELEEAGDYEAALSAIRPFWRPGERPAVDGLNAGVAAEVFLRAGALCGWMGSARQRTGAQEEAKDLISEGMGIFESLGETVRVVESRADLALCYWREGSFDEARIILQEALSCLDGRADELKAAVLVRSAIVEFWMKRPDDAFRLLREAAPMVERSNNHALKGKLHVEWGNALRELSAVEDRDNCLDRALLEYSAASHHFEQAGHTRYCARVENNLALLLLELAKFEEAQVHLDRARRFFSQMEDVGSVAQVDETRARALLAEGRGTEAERIIALSVETLERGDEKSLLAVALTTQGKILARQSRFDEARKVLERAIGLGEQTGDLEGAGRAALTLFEELGHRLDEQELRSVYVKADDLLSNSKHTETQARLRACVRRMVTPPCLPHAVEKDLPAMCADKREWILKEAGSADPNPEAAARTIEDSPAHDGPIEHAPTPWHGCNLADEVLRHEGELIRRALEASKGSITHAARLLGTSYQNLSFTLQGRHKELLAARTPAKRRLHSIIKLPRRARRSKP